MPDPGDTAGDLSLRQLLDRIDDAVFVLDADWCFTYANVAASKLLGSDAVAIQGKHAEEVIHSATWTRLQAHMAQVVESGESTSFVALIPETQRWFDYHVHPFDGLLVVVARDVTPVKESVEAREALLSDSRRETHFSEALNRLNRSIVSEPDIDSVLNSVVRVGMDALGVESAYIDVLDDGELVLRHAHGLAKDAYGRRLDPEGVPLLVAAADKREPAVVVDVSGRDDLDPTAFERIGIRSVLAVPLVVQGHILGFLSFATHGRPHEWTAEEVRFVRRVAVRASLALQNLLSQQDLQASEKRFRSTFDLAPVGIANQGLDGRWLRVNARMCEIVGRDRSSLLESRYRDITHPDDYEVDTRLFDALVQGHIPSYTREKLFVLPDGTLKWGQISRSLVRTLEGAPDYVVTIIEDIDARKRAEEQLARSRARERLLTDMLEDASQPFAVGEIGGDLIMCNDAFMELTGYTMTEFIEGDSIWGQHLMPPEWEQIAENDGLALDEGRPARFGRQYMRRDGTIVPVEVLAHLFLPEKGRPLVYAFITDVTARVAAEDRARLSQALNEIDEELGKQLSAVTSLPHILDIVADILGLQCAAVLSAEAEGLRVSFGFQMPEDTVGEVFNEDEADYGTRALRENRTIVAEDALAEAGPASLATRLNVHSLVAVPLRRGNQRHGAMVFCRGEGSPTFSESEVAFITTVAAHTSLAVENAALYENEHRVAQTLQEALLKLPDELPGVEFARSYQSSSIISKVGGDFYDVFTLDDRRIGIVVGDVAGKGLEAAALNARARASIRAELGVAERSPADVLGRVNELFASESDDHVFFTVFVGVLDRTSGRLDYASGGHTTSAAIQPDGSVTQLPATGPIVGAFSGLEFEGGVIDMEAGGVLFAYTDGLIEARGDGGLYGEERLFGSLAKHAGSSPQGLVEGVIDDVLVFATVLTDDVAVLAVKWLG